MKFKKIMSLLLVLTLIGTMLTTVSLLNPVAEDGEEATTPTTTTNYDTHVMHVVGNSTTNGGIALFYTVPADNVKAGETYTINMVAQDMSLNGQAACLFVREGSANSSTVLAASYDENNPGTTTTLYSGAFKWTAEVTPTTQSALFIGIRLAKANTQAANFYMGALEVIDSKGNNIAPELNESTAIYYTTSLTGLIQSVSGKDLSDYLTTLEMKSIDAIEDADLKQKLVNNFYTGDSMINFKMGSTQGLLNLFKKIPASKLKPNTTYTYTVRYNNPEGFGDASRYFVIREGSTRTAFSASGTHTKLSGYVDCYEFTADYTTGETAQDLYVGFRINGSGWQLADLYIADMQFVEAGKTANLLTPITDMDYWCASSDTTASTINRYTATAPTTVCEFVAITKQILDRDRFFEPENKEAAKYLLHAKGLASPSTVRGIAVQVPTINLTEGESYTVNVTLQSNKALNSTYNVLLVQSGEDKGGLIAHSGASTAEAKGTTTSLYSGAIKWSVNITPDASKNIYIGMYFNTSNLTDIDFYLGDIEVIDSNGDNVAPALMHNTGLYAFASWGGAIITPSATSEDAFFEKREFVRMDKIEDETLKQTLYNNFYGGDSMLKLSVGSSNAQQVIYKKIPAEALVGNKKYKLSIKYSGLTLSANDYIVVRDIATAASPVMTSSGKQATNVDAHTNYSEYTDYYTTPETPTDLYIGFYLRQSAWSTAQLYIGDMQFVDGDGKNHFTSIADTSDLYSGYNNGAISQFTTSNTFVKLEKQVLDTEKFSDPVSTERKMINVSNLSGGNNAKFYVKVPHMLAGTYQVTYKTKGIDWTDGRYFDVRTNTPLATNSSSVVTTTQVSEPSLDEETLEFTVTDFSDIYVGFTVPMKHVTNMNFYIEKLELVKIEDGVTGENLIDENLDIAKFHRHNANNGETEAWTVLNINANGYADYSTVFRVTVMDYDKNILDPEQIVNIKGGEEVAATYQYGKQASGLKAGTYRLTVVQQGADIKNTQNPHFWVSVNGTVIEDTYNESAREKVTLIGTSAYKYQTDITIAEDGGVIYGGFAIGYTTMPKFNTYITEFSLVRVENDAVVGGNLFADLNVRDWSRENGEFVTYDKYNASNQSINYLNLGVADANGNGKVDVADIRILSKMQDAGIEVTDATNVTTLRNNLLNAVS